MMMRLYRTNYLIACHLLVLVIAFLILPLPKAMGMTGVVRFVVGSSLYIGFVLLLIYSNVFTSSIGRWIYPYADNYVQEEENDAYANPYQYKETYMHKKQSIATNIYFQCMLIELFALCVLVNSDYTLLISNPVTQNVADILSNHIRTKEHNGFFATIDMDVDLFSSMKESLFFIYFVFIASFVIRLVSMLIFSRGRKNFFHIVRDLHEQPVFEQGHIFVTMKNVLELSLRFIWAIIATLVLSWLIFIGIFVGITHLDQYVTLMNSVGGISDVIAMFSSILKGLFAPRAYGGEITKISSWLIYSGGYMSIAILLILMFFQCMEDWYKLIFRKF